MEHGEQAHLLVLKSNDGTYTVLEFESDHFLTGKMEAAIKLGIWCQKIELEDLDREEYRNARFFDMRDPVVCKIFFLEQWTHFFQLSEPAT